MRKEKSFTNKDGTIFYYVLSCDWCSKSGTERDFKFIPLEAFFHDWRYLFTKEQSPEIVGKAVNDENIKKIACSTQCCESLMKIAMSDFYRAWNAANK